MSSGVDEIAVGTEELEVVCDAELRDECVDRAELHARSATVIAQFCGCDVVVASGVHVRERPQPLAKVSLRALRQKTLEKLLHDQACGHDQVGRERRRQLRNSRTVWRGVASQSEGPHARIDENGHARERSPL